jgi:hypothetical protein
MSLILKASAILCVINHKKTIKDKDYLKDLFILFFESIF